MIPIYVPAQVHYRPKVEHHILVESGSNWDMASVALVTPIVELRSPVVVKVVTKHADAPKEADPAAAAHPAVNAPVYLKIDLHFTGSTAALVPSDKTKILKINKSTPLFIRASSTQAGLAASRLCRVRASVVASMLRAYGYQVTELPANCSVVATAAPIEVLTYHPAA